MMIVCVCVCVCVCVWRTASDCKNWRLTEWKVDTDGDWRNRRNKSRTLHIHIQNETDWRRTKRQVIYDYFRLRHNVLLECAVFQVHTDFSEEYAASVFYVEVSEVRVRLGYRAMLGGMNGSFRTTAEGRDAETSLGQSEWLLGLSCTWTLGKRCSELREKRPLQDIETSS
jgi:hypothetical protein